MQSVASALSRLGELASSVAVSRLSAAFSSAGHELALVGGSVRDAFLDRTVSDLDFTTDARPDRILDIVGPISETWWDIGREYGTIGARIAGRDVEITTYRSDRYDHETRKPDVMFGDDLDGDLVRRDFTINALALRLPHVVLVDPSGGVDDLLAKILRTPKDAGRSFGDDPLRMLRAARFVAQLGFNIDPRARGAISERAGHVDIVSAERIRDELGKLLCAPEPHAGIDLLVETGLADHVLPEVPALRLEHDGEHRHKDVYAHSLTVLDQAIELETARHPGKPPDLIVRLAALLHDIGKPTTKRVERGGIVSFYLHDVVGAKLAAQRLRQLRFDNETIAGVRRLIELHLRFFGYAEGAWTDSAVRRYVRDAGPYLERLHILTRADVTTRNRRKADRLSFAYDDLEARIHRLSEAEELASVRPDLDGKQIMQILGIGPGRSVGDAYRFLLELRLDSGPLSETEAALKLREWWKTR